MMKKAHACAATARGIFAAMLLTASATAALAQGAAGYPSQPIKLMVPKGSITWKACSGRLEGSKQKQ